MQEVESALERLKAVQEVSLSSIDLSLVASESMSNPPPSEESEENSSQSSKPSEQIFLSLNDILQQGPSLNQDENESESYIFKPPESDEQGIEQQKITLKRLDLKFSDMEC